MTCAAARCVVQPGPVAVLRALAGHHGRVQSDADIRHAALNWAGADDHATEMAVSGLRSALPVSYLIQTVVRRGADYRPEWRAVC